MPSTPAAEIDICIPRQSARVRLWPIATLPEEFMSAMPGGLNGSAQHSILKGKDGVLQCVEVFSRLQGGRKSRALGSLRRNRNNGQVSGGPDMPRRGVFAAWLAMLAPPL